MEAVMFKSGLSRRVVGCTIGVVMCAVTLALCCDTPVYRFAMYNWRPTPYEVYYFYTGQVPQADKDVNAAIRQSAEGHQPNECRAEGLRYPG